MSKGIARGSYVKLEDGSRGFIDPAWNEPKYDTPCWLGCRADDCMEWANVRLDDGSFLFHINECHMELLEPGSGVLVKAGTATKGAK